MRVKNAQTEQKIGLYKCVAVHLVPGPHSYSCTEDIEPEQVARDLAVLGELPTEWHAWEVEVSEQVALGDEYWSRMIPVCCLVDLKGD